MDRKFENPLPPGESQAGWASRMASTISGRGSGRIPTAEVLAMVAFTVGLVAGGGVLGGEFAGSNGAFVGGIIGLAAGVSVSSLIRDLIHGPSIS